jgi:hypothetical protein
MEKGPDAPPATFMTAVPDSAPELDQPGGKVAAPPGRESIPVAFPGAAASAATRQAKEQVPVAASEVERLKLQLAAAEAQLGESRLQVAGLTAAKPPSQGIEAELVHSQKFNSEIRPAVHPEGVIG